MENCFDEYKIIFLVKRDKSWISQTFFQYNGVYHNVFLKSLKCKSNLLNYGILVQGLIMTTNTTPFFRDGEANLEDLRTFWMIEECWYNSQKWKICPRNKNRFFWESEANLEISWKLSLFIEVSYNSILKSVKIINWIFWTMEYWFKTW